MLAALAALVLAADPPQLPAPASAPPTEAAASTAGPPAAPADASPATARAAAPAPAEAAPSTQPAGPRTVAGKIGLVSLAESRLTLEVADGTLPLTIDRNTLVFLETQLGTVRDLVSGMPARAAVTTDGRAVWVELRPRGVVPTRSR